MKRLLLVLLLAATLHAGPDEDWKAIVAMDAGPSAKPASIDQARSIARAHITKSRQLLEAFLKANPDDPRAFDAKMRLASHLAAIGKMDKRQSQVDEAMIMLQNLEKDKSAPLEKRADAGFRRVSLYMQSLTGRENENRREIVNAAKNFQYRFPNDRRAPRLLVEVATICDSDPVLKKQLLDEARSISKEEALNRRIADDLKRLALLGKPLPLRFSAIQGGTFDIASQHGRLVFLIFWSGESAPSLLWMEEFRLAMAKLPADRITVATISLDKDSSIPRDRIKELGISDWPTACDGKGWDDPIARQCGINALPTVFLFDQQGVLQTTNARTSYESWIRKLIIQNPR